MGIFNHWLENSAVVRKAHDFAQQAHADTKRLSGELYFDHTKRTGEIIANWRLDEATIAAAILHDTVENTAVKLEELKKEFGEEIAFLVDGVTKLKHVKYYDDKAEMENMRKFVLAISKDIRVVLIQLANRLQNMRTVNSLPADKQLYTASETMEIYAPLAYRLGMFVLSGQIADLAFPIVHPAENKWMDENVKEHYQQREVYAQKIKPLIKSELENNGVNVISVLSRAKRRASLYKKLLRYDMNLDRIYDLVAIRCLVGGIADCYEALGIIHKKWAPVPNRIKDYIALPKPNGYRSLHTTIFGPEGKTIEIQIKTREMHDEAENGIAAHWAYQQQKQTKHYKTAISFAKQQEVALTQQLRNWQTTMIANPDEFVRSFKIDFLEDRIFSLTPKGKIIDLPRGSTPVDFAYQIHSEIGNSCIGARINGKIAPLSNQLESGDVVEILTQKNKKPSRDWLEFVKTSIARGHVKAHIRSRDKKLGAGSNKVEFKAHVEDRIGLLKDVAGTIARAHVNIISHSTMPPATSGKLRTMKIVCSLTDAGKIKKIASKIEALKGVRSIEYRFF